MNEEKLTFMAEGEPYETGDCGMFCADVTVVGSMIWFARIQIYGGSPEDAKQLRERLLWAYAQPTVPAQWQARHPVDEPGAEPLAWFNLDHGGEAATKKGEGYEVRALYAKQPLEA